MKTTALHTSSGILLKIGIISVFFFTILIKNTSLISAQRLDSLLAELPKQKEDTFKVKLLSEIIKEYINNDIEKMPYYVEQMLITSKKIHYAKGEGNAYVRYADYYRRTRNWPKALPYLELADSVYTKTNDKQGRSFVDNMKGVYYTENGQFEKALVMHQKALDYYINEKDTFLQAATISVIAKLFYYMQRYDEAEQYYMKALNIYRDLGNKKEACISLLNIGSLYVLKEEYKKAEYYFNLCLELQKELQQTGVLGKIQWNMGWIYSETNRPEQALKMLNESYENYTRNQDTLMLGMVKLYMAHTYNKTGDYNKAMELLEEGKKMANIGQADSIVMGDFYREYYQVYKNSGDYKKALEYHEKYIANKSEVYSTNTANKISELREKYETEKKEQENLTLRNEKEIRDLRLQRQWYLIYGLGGLFVLVILVLALLIRTNRVISEQKNMKLEQKLLRSQMNPHFVFNSLTAIQSYVFKNDPKSAGKFLSSFAKLMRGILENSREEYITLSKEINWLQNYIELQKLRFENRFEYNIEIPSSIDQENLLVPPMLIQPFIENSLEHGLSEKEYGGLLNISFINAEGEIQVKISDNGKGFSTNETKEKKADHNSLATIITRERLALLNKNKKKKIVFTISSEPGNGTVVIFHIPNRTKY